MFSREYKILNPKHSISQLTGLRTDRFGFKNIQSVIEFLFVILLHILLYFIINNRSGRNRIEIKLKNK